MRRSPATRRPGFTLIEVLVAAGLCMLIMAILASAFASGVDTFSLLKSTGELDGRLKVAQAVLRADLTAPHLEAETGEPVKVSQLRYDRIGSNDRFARPQPLGFFRITQEVPLTAPVLAAPNVTYAEGLDPDGVPSTRAVSHTLQMAVRLRADRMDRVALAKLPQNNTGPGGTSNLSAPEVSTIAAAAGSSLSTLDPNGIADRFSSQWAEVSYFLSTQPTGGTVGTPQLPLFSLHRRVRAVLPRNAPGAGTDWGQFNNTRSDPTTATTGAPGLSYRMVVPPMGPPQWPLNTINDLSDPSNRTGGATASRLPSALDPLDQLSPLGTGEDILLTNVLSFEVKAAWDPGGWVIAEGTPVMATPVAAPGGTELPFDDLPLTPSVPAGFSQSQGMTTIQYPNGSGNNLFQRDQAGVTNATTSRCYDTGNPQGGWDRPTIPAGTNQRNPNPGCLPLPIRLKAVQIKIRLYDPKNKLTRQLTLIQDL